MKCRKVLAVVVITLKEWIGGENGTQPEATPLRLHWPDKLSDEQAKSVAESILKFGIDIDPQSACNDWVDVMQVIDDRKSILPVGSNLIVYETGQVAVVSGPIAVRVDRSEDPTKDDVVNVELNVG